MNTASRRFFGRTRRCGSCMVIVAALASTARAADISIPQGSSQSHTLTVADLTGGAGSDFPELVYIGSPFELLVTPAGQNILVYVSRSGSGWLTQGTLQVQVKNGSNYASPVPVGITDQFFFSTGSVTPSTGVSFYEVRYLVQSATVQNAPGTYSTSITFTVVDP